MFKKARPRTPKGEATRRRALEAALDLFRRRGFDGTTMRDIAQAAGLSLGAAYHYFPSKDALVMAYYEWLQSEHERRAAAARPEGSSLATKLAVLLRTKLDLLARDRKVLAALFRNVGDPAHPLSVFSRQTAPIRRRSIAQFEEAFAEVNLPLEWRRLAGLATWLLHLGLILFFIHDRSRGQVRTRRLADALVESVTGALPYVGLPFAAAARERLLGILRELGFVGKGAR
jgi:AcrR family transcriptional regulator